MEKANQKLVLHSTKWKNFFEKITFSKNAGLLYIEASKNGGINDSAIFSISR